MLLFGQALAAHSALLHLAPADQAALQAQAGNLGGAQPPAGLPAAQRDLVQQAIRMAFVDTFRVLMLICASLAWLSALLAAVLVDKRLAPDLGDRASSAPRAAPNSAGDL